MSKATYYADATLLPDRGSARRREEAALAAELDALCELLPNVARVRSSVSLARTPSAVVVVQHETLVDPHAGDRDGASPSGQGDVESLEAMIQVIAAGVVPGAEIDVLTLPRTPPGPSPAGSTDGAPEPTRGPLQSASRTVLWLALGITLGVLFERIASRRNLRRA